MTRPKRTKVVPSNQQKHCRFCENSYFFAQVILAIFAGQIVDLAKDNRLYMVISSVSGMISAILSLRLTYDAAPDDIKHQKSKEEGSLINNEW